MSSYDPNNPQQQPVYTQPLRPRRRRINFRLACLGCLLAMVTSFVLFSCVVGVVGAIVWSNLWNRMTDTWNTKLKEQQQQTFQTTRIYDRAGNQLHELFTEGRRTEVKLVDIPKSLRDATIAVEDSSFYDNPGVDWVGISRAGLQYFGQGEALSGGSTITQQLVRTIAFSYDYRIQRSPQRKLEEIIMALVLTRQKSKDEILEMYLNQIYYGNLAYGIEAASQTYFGKSAKDLTLAEASLLAGLPQAPAEFDPLNPDPKVQEEVQARRKVVLDLMVDKGKITRDQATAALNQPLFYANPNVALHSPHFTLYAEQELKSLIEGLKLPPSTLNTAGLKVYTTLDQNFETLAENTARQQINAIKQEHNARNSAVVVLKPSTGEILAMMGSVDYNDASIQGRVNVATSPKQPGSAMKPLTYAAAMERGFSPSTILWDVETHIKTPGDIYSPLDYDRTFHGPVRLRTALANSYNIPAVQTLRTIGVPALMEIAQRFRITSLGTDPSRYGLALTLGGGALTPLELTQAYSVFANGGNLVSATSILCVIDSRSHVIYQYEGGCTGKGDQDAATINTRATAKAVLDPRIAFMISDILGDNQARSPAMGSNSPLRTDNIISSVKTGTTNDFRDNWTVGYTHNVAVGVWVGNTDNSPMIHTTGLTGAAPIWHDIIAGIYNDPNLMNTLKRAGNLLPDDLILPPGLVKKRLCALSALQDPAAACTPGQADWFLETPALITDANGHLVPSVNPAIQPTRQPSNGPLLVDIEPDIVQTAVQRIDPSLAISLVNNQPGLPPSPLPEYCLVPQEVRNQIPSATDQVFIEPPPFPDAAAYARIWATNHGVAILPKDPCTPEMLVPPPPPVDGVVAQIASPHPGETVTKMVQVSGNVSWPPDRGVFFKMEIQGPQFPGWTTFGSTHNDPVSGGLLDQFGAEGLQPGVYRIRITIIGKDGGILANSAEIPVNVTGG